MPVRHFLAKIRQQVIGWKVAWDFSRRPFTRVEGPPSVLMALDPPRHGLVKGGRVKGTALSRAFPGTFESFNILYLVSSALPQHPGAWIARARRGGARVVWNQNGVGYPAWAGELTEPMNRQMRRHIASAHRVIFQSEFCRRASHEFLSRDLPPANVLHNAVDTAAFTPPGAIPSLDPLRLLLAGTHLFWYRIQLALQTARVLVDRGIAFDLKIAGPHEYEGGIERARAEMMSLGLSSQVALTGPYTRDEAPRLYREAHILFHTQYQDACPTVLLEAMAAGLPIVGMRSGGIPELVGDEAGRLVDVLEDWHEYRLPDPARLADALLAARESWSAHSRAGRERVVAHFDEKEWIEAHRRIFVEELGNQPR